MNTDLQTQWQPEAERWMIALRIAGPSAEPLVYAPAEVRDQILNQAGIMWGVWFVGEMGKGGIEASGAVFGPVNQCSGLLVVSDLAAGLRRVRELLAAVSLLPFSQFGWFDEREGFFRTWYPTTGGVADLGSYVSVDRMKQATREIQELATFWERHRSKPGGNQR